MEKERKRQNQGGRPIKVNPADYRYSVNFDAVENARFLSMFDRSGLRSKAAFIKARVFGESFRVTKRDRGTMEYVAKLTQFHSQYRAIGVNYNQVVKLLLSHFTEHRALSMLYKLEKATYELVKTNEKVIALSEEFKEKWWLE